MDKPTQLSLFHAEEQRKPVRRSQVKPLYLPADIHAVLLQLEIGQMVPTQVLIVDYKDGTIPPWIIREIEHCDHALILTVCDESIIYPASATGPEHCTAMDVITLETKTLAGPFYGYYPGCVHARNPLADIRQHARQMVDRNCRAERQVVA